jgi:hypothetical protein
MPTVSTSGSRLQRTDSSGAVATASGAVSPVAERAEPKPDKAPTPANTKAPNRCDLLS